MSVFDLDCYENLIDLIENKTQEGDRIHTKSFVVVDFYALWCGPCKRFSPTYESLAKEFQDDFLFVKVNIDVVSDIADEYKISALPSFLIFKTGNAEVEVERLVGVVNKEIFITFLKKVLRPPKNS